MVNEKSLIKNKLRVWFAALGFLTVMVISASVYLVTKNQKQLDSLLNKYSYNEKTITSLVKKLEAENGSLEFLSEYEFYQKSNNVQKKLNVQIENLIYWQRNLKEDANKKKAQLKITVTKQKIYNLLITERNLNRISNDNNLQMLKEQASKDPALIATLSLIYFIFVFLFCMKTKAYIKGVIEELKLRIMALGSEDYKLPFKMSEHNQIVELYKTLDTRQEFIEIHNDEMEKKAQALEEADNYKSDFLSNMSHELRTPLNSLLILSKMLVENDSNHLDEDEVKSADIIHGCGSELLVLINDILDLSKVESGNMDIVIDDFNPFEIKISIMRNFEAIAKKKGIAINVITASDVVPLLKTDKQKLDQILKNLISNAIKFTDSGAIDINISTPKDLPIGMENNPSECILFSVKDQGIGIPQDKLEIVFEAFKQVDGSTKRKYGGTGLGLSISKNFAKVLKGDLVVKSTEGAGSEFSLYLPREYSDIKEEIASLKATTGNQNILTKEKALNTKDLNNLPDDRDSDLASEKILLIIEDDPRFAQILINTGRQNGFKCIHAPDGELGISYSIEYKPNAIILDIMLPQMDGWAVLSRLKENTLTRHVPVQFISCMEGNLEAFKQGAISYMTKPLGLGELKQVFLNFEEKLNQPLKRILIASNHEDFEQIAEIKNLIENQYNSITKTTSAKEALEYLKNDTFECMIITGDEDVDSFIQTINIHPTISIPPIVLYSGAELGHKEKTSFREFTNKHTLVNACSKEKILDEVNLFLHQTHAELTPKQSMMIQSCHDSLSIFKNKHVLLVDDDMRNIFSLSKVLKKQGLKVTIAENGEVALKKLAVIPDFDLVLMDIMMPIMDGHTAIKKIRDQVQFKNLPVIALTANAMKGDREKCLMSGASDYLSKPVDVERLLIKLRDYLYEPITEAKEQIA